MVESQNIEYKESWRDEYLKWVCGFANAQGGTIFIGIDDAGRVVGARNIKKLLEEMGSLSFYLLHNKINKAYLEFERFKCLKKLYI